MVLVAIGAVATRMVIVIICRFLSVCRVDLCDVEVGVMARERLVRFERTLISALAVVLWSTTWLIAIGVGHDGRDDVRQWWRCLDYCASLIDVRRVTASSNCRDGRTNPN